MRRITMITSKMQEYVGSHMFTSSPNAVKHASDLVARGEIISVPTDTVYGVCCSANNNDAIQKLFNIKSRTFNKPISLCFGNITSIEKWANTKHIPRNLINMLLPGPVTLLLSAKKDLNKLLTKNSDVSGKMLVGVRIPENNFIQSLCGTLADPIALTSANVSGKSDSVEVEEFRELWPYLTCIFDHGKLGYRASSTVIDLSEPNLYKIVRVGAGLENVKRCLTEFDYEAYT